MQFNEVSRLTICEILEAHNRAEKKRYAALMRKNRKPRPNREQTRFGLGDWMLISAGTVLVGILFYI